MTKLFLAAFLIFCTIAMASAQQLTEKDKRISITDSTHSPQKAVMLSLILPGAGQVYNHDLWKVPIVYAGLVTFVSTTIYNQSYYNKMIAVLKIRRPGTLPTPGSTYYPLYIKYKTAYNQFSGFTTGQLTDLSSTFQRDRDLSILGIIGMWGINVIDAYIHAKFIKSYSMDNNLTFRISPDIINENLYSANSNPVVPVLKITFYTN